MYFCSRVLKFCQNSSFFQLLQRFLFSNITGKILNFTSGCIVFPASNCTLYFLFLVLNFFPDDPVPTADNRKEPALDKKHYLYLHLGINFYKLMTMYRYLFSVLSLAWVRCWIEVSRICINIDDYRYLCFLPSHQICVFFWVKYLLGDRYRY